MAITSAMLESGVERLSAKEVGAKVRGSMNLDELEESATVIAALLNKYEANEAPSQGNDGEEYMSPRRLKHLKQRQSLDPETRHVALDSIKAKKRRSLIEDGELEDDELEDDEPDDSEGQVDDPPPTSRQTTHQTDISDSDSDFLDFEAEPLGGIFDSFNVPGAKLHVDELLAQMKTELTYEKTKVINFWFEDAVVGCQEAEEELEKKEQDCIAEFESLEQAHLDLQSEVEGRSMNSIMFMRKFYQHVVNARMPKREKKDEKRNAGFMPDFESAEEARQRAKKEERRRRLMAEMAGEKAVFGKDNDFGFGGDDAGQDVEEFMDDVNSIHAKAADARRKTEEARLMLQRQKSMAGRPIPAAMIASELLEVISAQQDEIANFRTRTDVDAKTAETVRLALEHGRVEREREEAEQAGNKSKKLPKVNLTEQARETMNDVTEQVRMKVITEMVGTKEGRALLQQCAGEAASNILEAQAQASDIVEETDLLKRHMEELQEAIDAVGSRKEREDSLREAVAEAKKAKEEEARRAAEEAALKAKMEEEEKRQGSKENADAPPSPSKKGKKKKGNKSGDDGDAQPKAKASRSKRRNSTLSVRDISKMALSDGGSPLSSPTVSRVPTTDELPQPGVGSRESSTNEKINEPKPVSPSDAAATTTAPSRDNSAANAPRIIVPPPTWIGTQPKEVQEQMDNVCVVMEKTMRNIHKGTDRLGKALEEKIHEGLEDFIAAEERRELGIVDAVPKEDDKDMEQVAEQRELLKERKSKLEKLRNRCIDLEQKHLHHKKVLRKRKKMAVEEEKDPKGRRTSSKAFSDDDDDDGRPQNRSAKKKMTAKMLSMVSEEKGAQNDVPQTDDGTQEDPQDQQAVARRGKRTSTLAKGGLARKKTGNLSAFLSEDDPALQEHPEVLKVKGQTAVVDREIEELQKQDEATMAKIQNLLQQRLNGDEGPTPSGDGRSDSKERSGSKSRAGSKETVRTENSNTREHSKAESDAGAAMSTPFGAAGSVAADSRPGTSGSGRRLIGRNASHGTASDGRPGTAGTAGSGGPGTEGGEAAGTGGSNKPQGATAGDPKDPTSGAQGEHADHKREEDTVVVDKREQQVKELLFYQSENDRLNQQIMEIEKKTKEAKNRMLHPGSAPSALTPGIAKDVFLPEENKQMRRDVVKKQRELNAIRQSWHAESEKHRRGAYEGVVPGQVEAAIRLLLRDPPKKDMVREKAEKEAVRRAQEQAEKLGADNDSSDSEDSAGHNTREASAEKEGSRPGSARSRPDSARSRPDSAKTRSDSISRPDTREASATKEPTKESESSDPRVGSVDETAGLMIGSVGSQPARQVGRRPTRRTTLGHSLAAMNALKGGPLSSEMRSQQGAPTQDNAKRKTMGPGTLDLAAVCAEAVRRVGEEEDESEPPEVSRVNSEHEMQPLRIGSNLPRKSTVGVAPVGWRTVGATEEQQKGGQLARGSMLRGLSRKSTMSFDRGITEQFDKVRQLVVGSGQEASSSQNAAPAASDETPEEESNSGAAVALEAARRATRRTNTLKGAAREDRGSVLNSIRGDLLGLGGQSDDQPMRRSSAKAVGNEIGRWAHGASPEASSQRIPSASPEASDRSNVPDRSISATGWIKCSSSPTSQPSSRDIASAESKPSTHQSARGTTKREDDETDNLSKKVGATNVALSALKQSLGKSEPASAATSLEDVPKVGEETEEANGDFEQTLVSRRPARGATNLAVNALKKHLTAFSSASPASGFSHASSPLEEVSKADELSKSASPESM